jgi:glutathione peroxidase
MLFNNPQETYMSIYDFKVKRPNGSTLDLATLRGKTILVVNTASKCGLTPQFGELEELHKKYGEKGLVVLGFPCGQFAGQELDSADEIHAFCQRNYGVTFEILDKIDVNGPNADPLFVYLRKKTGGIFGNSVKWNFTKFLVNREGTAVIRYAPTTKPAKIAGKIERFLAENNA